MSFSAFLLGLLFAIFSVLSVYFLNDYADEKEDREFKKPNIYLLFNDKTSFFWILTACFFLTGGFFSLRNSIVSFSLFVLFYLLNWFYSFLPFRLRDKSVLREMNIFTIYIIKFLLFVTFLQYPLLQIPLSIVFMAGAITVAALSIYKNYLRGIVKETYIYFIVFILLMLITAKQYPLILLLVLPVIPLFIIAIIRGKKMQIPINRFQFGYFLYAVFILLIVTTFNLI